MEIKIQDDDGKGYLNNVLIKDNTFEHFSPNQSRLRGLDDEHVISGVAFDNLVIAGKRRMDLADSQIAANGYVENVSFK
ncbi:hypothetical protein ACFL6S_32655 [Candidatus Poribacteria bacterium]